MKAFLTLFLTFSFLPSALATQIHFHLSKQVYNYVPFSSQYSEDGALIQNVNYEAVKQLIPQIESVYGVKLEDRNEAHITVLTPPEAQGWNNNGIGVNTFIATPEIQSTYRHGIQNNSFQVLCLGSRTDGHKLVFYLVVNSPGSLVIRQQLQTVAHARAATVGVPPFFNAQLYWPHITIGYVNGDVHGVTKGVETCLPNTSIIEY